VKRWGKGDGGFKREVKRHEKSERRRGKRQKVLRKKPRVMTPVASRQDKRIKKKNSRVGEKTTRTALY